MSPLLGVPTADEKRQQRRRFGERRRRTTHVAGLAADMASRDLGEKAGDRGGDDKSEQSPHDPEFEQPQRQGEDGKRLQRPGVEPTRRQGRRRGRRRRWNLGGRHHWGPSAALRPTAPASANAAAA